MIYVDLKGNLGNQMFIYAFARKVQAVTNQKIYFSQNNLNRYFKEYKFSLDEFVLNDNCIVGNKKMPYFMNDNTILAKFIKKMLNSKFLKRIQMYAFNKNIKKGKILWLDSEYIGIDFDKLKKFKDIYINGFWQSPKYFDDIKDILKKELTPKNGVKNENKELLDLIRNTNSVCVSIRRGDYISNPKITRKYYLCDECYFKKAILKLEKLESNINIICFSDDIEWVKENISFKHPTFYESGKDTVSQKVLLMSSCKNFILSNSSFSWWVQYLSSNPNCILAPSKWYYDNSGKDIYQDNWILISV